jgi:ferritin
MRMNADLACAMTDHAGHEYANALIYLDLYNYYRSISLEGFAAWAWSQYEGELTHAQKFIVFLNDALVKTRLLRIPNVDSDEIQSPQDAQQRAYDREVGTTQRIYDLRTMAKDKGHDGAFAFLEWFVNEQIEEENTTNDLLNQVKLATGNIAALFVVDSKLK